MYMMHVQAAVFWGGKLLYGAWFLGAPAARSHHGWVALAALWLTAEAVAGWTLAMMFQVRHVRAVLGAGCWGWCFRVLCLDTMSVGKRLYTQPSVPPALLRRVTGCCSQSTYCLYSARHYVLHCTIYIMYIMYIVADCNLHSFVSACGPPC